MCINVQFICYLYSNCTCNEPFVHLGFWNCLFAKYEIIIWIIINGRSYSQKVYLWIKSTSQIVSVNKKYITDTLSVNKKYLTDTPHGSFFLIIKRWYTKWMLFTLFSFYFIGTPLSVRYFLFTDTLSVRYFLFTDPLSVNNVFLISYCFCC